MFKTAPRYLSGVSVFYGDDINRREIDGELAIFIGQATKGPAVPVQLKSVDGAIAIFGTDNPLVKALYQFVDGYTDGGKTQPMKFVAYRVGGIPATIVTSYGLEATSTDAYNGIEDEYFIFVNDATAETAKVKMWDKNKLLVLDSSAGINTGHFTLTSTPTGTSGKIYGVDIDADPLETPVTLSGLVKADVVNPSGVQVKLQAAVLADATALVGDSDISDFPSTGTLKVSEVTGAIEKTAFITYSAINVGTKTFTLDEAIGTGFSTNAKVSLVGTVLVNGDSELGLAPRDLYEKMRNSLLDIEMFTPDYVLPGVPYNTKEKYTKVYTESTILKSNLADTDTYAVVDAAATWPSAGVIDIFDGVDHNFMKYSGKAVLGSDYKLTLETPTFELTDVAISGLTSLAVASQLNGAPVADLLEEGYIKIGATVHKYTMTVPGTIVLDVAVSVADAAASTGMKVPGTALANITTVGATFSQLENFELGIGYVKETNQGDHFEFEWNDTKQPGFNIAHFGYLFANFCNDAAVGYNTPLCGMNVVAPAGLDRASIVSWIGKLPEYKVRVDNMEAVETVVKNGTGLLGEATLAGTVNYNRCYMSVPDEGVYADPAFGLLMTDEGFVDGHEIKDSYNKVVDLGKFMVVGAGLLTFNNRAKATSYVDSCGIYALGMLAGKPQNEGISFARIGTGSNTSVSVIVTRNLYNDLASLGYIVVTREKGLGWVINNSHSAARNDSAYYLISTTRTVKYVVEGKRAILVSFIGKPVNRFIYEAARTRLAESFSEDVKKGLLATVPVWDLQAVQTANAIGKFELQCTLNPALELTQVDVDAVIERTANLG